MNQLLDHLHATPTITAASTQRFFESVSRSTNPPACSSATVLPLKDPIHCEVNECGKSFTQKHNRDAHQRSCGSVELNLICPLCSAPFKDPTVFSRHKKECNAKMNRTEEPWCSAKAKDCTYKKAFSSERSLRQHEEKCIAVQGKKRDRPYKCPAAPKCQKDYADNMTYKIHLQVCRHIHNTKEDIKAFKCSGSANGCPSAYTDPSSCRRHEKGCNKNKNKK